MLCGEDLSGQCTLGFSGRRRSAPGSLGFRRRTKSRQHSPQGTGPCLHRQQGEWARHQQAGQHKPECVWFATEAEWTRENATKRPTNLANLLTSSFYPHKELKINLKGKAGLVLPELLEAGQQFHEQKAREAEQLKEEELHGRRKRKKEDKLKFQEKVVEAWFKRS